MPGWRILLLQAPGLVPKLMAQAVPYFMEWQNYHSILSENCKSAESVEPVGFSDSKKLDSIMQK